MVSKFKSVGKVNIKCRAGCLLAGDPRYEFIAYRVAGSIAVID